MAPLMDLVEIGSSLPEVFSKTSRWLAYSQVTTDRPTIEDPGYAGGGLVTSQVSEASIRPR